MNKKKILLVVVSVVVLFFIGLIVLANILITPERVRQTVVPFAEEHLNRKVELGEIDISLFSGIAIKDMAVAKKEGEGSLVAAEKVVLRYSLLALLTFQVKVDEVTLVKPAIEIIRKKDGSFNFSDLVVTEEGIENKPAAEPEKGGTGTPIDLHVSQVSISDGRLLFVDHAAAGGTERHEVTHFNLMATDVSTAAPFPLELAADWNGNVLGVKGRLDPAGSGADLEAFFNRVRLSVKGNVAGEQPAAELRLPKTSLNDIFASVPAAYAPADLGKGLSGSVVFSLSLADGAVTLQQLDAVVNDQSFKLNASVADINASPVRVKTELTSDLIVVDKLLVEQAAQSGGGSSVTSTKTTEDSEIGPFDIPVDLTATVKIGKVVYNQIPIINFGLDASLRNNLLSVATLKGQLAGGSFRNNSTVNLGVKGLKYRTDLTVNSIQGRELVQLFKPEMAEAVQGTVEAAVKLKGQGTLPDNIKKKLNGQGRLTLADGRLQSIPALDAVAALLDVSELRQVELDEGAVDFSIEDGKVSLTSNITGSTTRLSTKGDVGLDGSLNLRSQLALSPELGGRLHAQGKLSRYLGDDGGWTTVPIHLKGSYDSPEVGLDSRGLKKQAERAVKKEVEKKLEKELQKGLQRLFGN